MKINHSAFRRLAPRCGPKNRLVEAFQICAAAGNANEQWFFSSLMIRLPRKTVARMQREISYEWSPELVRRGTRRFISRYVGRSLVVFAIVMVLALVALSVGQREIFWWVVVILPIIYGSAWWGYYKRALKICDEMPDRKVTVRIEPETITFETTDQTTTMKWSRIRKLWRYPDVLLLFTYDQQTYSMLPAGPLGEDGTRFIEEKVREHGGQVA